MDININELKKDLYKSKVNATFLRYTPGKMFYRLEALGKVFVFPIYVIENDYSWVIEVKTIEEMATTQPKKVLKGIKHTEDFGNNLILENQIKASLYIKWIEKAIAIGEFHEIEEVKRLPVS